MYYSYEFATLIALTS